MAPVGDFEASELLGLEQDACRAVLVDLSKDVCGSSREELEFKSFSDCAYLTSKALGIQVRLMAADLGRACVDVVFLYNEGDGFSQYSAGPLPEGLQWTQHSKDVVLMLGEPSDKYGGGRFRAVGISYETLGLDIQFRESNWNDEKNPMAFISIFPRLDPSHGLCEMCGKRASFRCGLCKERCYCSSKCQKADWTKHQTDCPGFLEKKATLAALRCQDELMLPRCQQLSQKLLPVLSEVVLDSMD
ncbi:Tdrd1 [Symbiodinium natans]|uniref:Tdrd1 protein n=1 Tax=Symbiodinium natans TaxID=878477 RepID=A0A812S7J7_9DINO|nr:Tdrd1 [Symbiodinium natans]